MQSQNLRKSGAQTGAPLQPKPKPAEELSFAEQIAQQSLKLKPAFARNGSIHERRSLEKINRKQTVKEFIELKMEQAQTKLDS